MQTGQSLKQKELFEDAERIIKTMENGGFQAAANWFSRAVCAIGDTFKAFEVETEKAAKPEARIVYKDKPGPEGLVVSFSPTRDRVYFYIGYELTKTCRIRLGDKLYLSEESDGEYRIGIIGDGSNAFTLSSAGGAVDYFKVTIPLRAVPFKKWIGRRAVDVLPGLGCVYFKV
jgi:hypothetical protein